jgi:hypothetical protein
MPDAALASELVDLTIGVNGGEKRLESVVDAIARGMGRSRDEARAYATSRLAALRAVFLERCAKAGNCERAKKPIFDALSQTDPETGVPYVQIDTAKFFSSTDALYLGGSGAMGAAAGLFGLAAYFNAKWDRAYTAAYVTSSGRNPGERHWIAVRDSAVELAEKKMDWSLRYAVAATVVSLALLIPWSMQAWPISAPAESRVYGGP